MDNHAIMALHLTDRFQQAAKVQALLTEYGSHIKTRIGLHRTEELGTAQGIILLELVGDEPGWRQLGQRLRGIEGVEVQEVVFAH
ncbi:MAG: hypothetical protein H6Q10_1979 [Acidobacteria bacterium]|nr:hypothetical protein [Acidobacteriota bacterium]